MIFIVDSHYPDSARVQLLIIIVYLVFVNFFYINSELVISLIVQRIHPLLVSYLIRHYNNVELIC